MSHPAVHLRSLLLASALVAFPNAAWPWEAPIEFGILSCSLAPSTAAPNASAKQVGEGRDIVCALRASLDVPDETYAGTLQFVGKAALLFEKGAVLLVAKAPASMKIVPGLLHQQYAASGGPEGNSAGSQAPLVGERNTSIVLHPLSPRFDQPDLALGQASMGLIIIMELQLKSAAG
jgi:Protein of unknown function (DUF992)